MNLHRARQLNLDPAFQRESVRTLADRKKLVDSILNSVPIPSIFLYKRSERNRLVYDVIDGKQRIESILMFVEYREFAEDVFPVRALIDGIDRPEEFFWADLKRRRRDGHRLSTRFLGSRIQRLKFLATCPTLSRSLYA